MSMSGMEDSSFTSDAGDSEEDYVDRFADLSDVPEPTRAKILRLRSLYTSNHGEPGVTQEMIEEDRQQLARLEGPLLAGGIALSTPTSRLRSIGSRHRHSI